MGWQRHQLDHMQFTCTSLHTDNHSSTSSLNFLQARHSSCRSTNSIESLKAAQMKQQLSNSPGSRYFRSSVLQRTAQFQAALSASFGRRLPVVVAVFAHRQLRVAPDIRALSLASRFAQLAVAAVCAAVSEAVIIIVIIIIIVVVDPDHLQWVWLDSLAGLGTISNGSNWVVDTLSGRNMNRWSATIMEGDM